MNERRSASDRRISKKVPAAIVALITISSAMVILTRSEGTPQREKRESLASIKVAVAERREVPVQLQAVGTVEAYANVSIKSRVDGQLVAVHFREGEDVKKGTMLFTIDPRPYEAAVKEARARLERDAALADKAERDARRYAELVAKNYVSSDKFEQFRANAEALRATVAADRAALERAQLNLEYCHIKSPMSGRTGRILVDEGAQIKANDDKGGMVEIMQIMPIHVGFAVPQQYLAEIKTHMAAGPLKVEAAIPESNVEPQTGTLSFLDNKVNTQTGTVLLKGTFANTDRLLWPGQFVTATLTLAIRSGVVVIPSMAVQVGQDGQFVYVVKPDMTVEMRPVALGMTLGDEVVVEKGLGADEKVVTEGQLRLVPGAKVRIAGS